MEIWKTALKLDSTSLQQIVRKYTWWEWQPLDNLTLKTVTWYFFIFTKKKTTRKYSISLLKLNEYFPSLIISGKHNDTDGVMCYHPALLETGWEILGAKYSLSFTTTVEAPFSLALEPKLPLWKYLMAHNGKTLFRIRQPSGINVSDYDVEAE